MQQGNVSYIESVGFVANDKMDEVRRVGGRWRVRISSGYAGMLPADFFSDYSDFVRLDGQLIKNEPRTSITLVTGMPVNETGATVDCVLKEYSYTPVSGIRTLTPRSKAEREFDALNFCRELGIPAVEPIACGARRSWNGMINSCFLLTRYEKGYVSWREWRKEHSVADMMEPLAGMACELGTAMRSLHSHKFFLMGPVGKNTIVRYAGGDRIDWRLLDMPYARSFGRKILAQWGQRRDLGLLIAALLKFNDDEVVERFMAAYLPDPLGEEDTVLRRRVSREVKVYRDETLIAWLSHNLKRTVKRLRRRLSKI